MHSSHPTTYTTQHVLYFSVLHPPHQQDTHHRGTKEEEKQCRTKRTKERRNQQTNSGDSHTTQFNQVEIMMNFPPLF